MRGWLVLPALVLALAASTAAQKPALHVPKTGPAPTLQPTGNPPPGEADAARIREVLAFEKAMEAAVVRGDAKTLDRMLSPDFIFTHGDGWTAGGAPLKTDTKASWLAWVAKQPPPYLYRELDHVQVELHGDTAITVGRYLYLPQPNTQAGHSFVWFERVYQKQNGEWKHLSHKTVKGPVREDDEPAGATAQSPAAATVNWALHNLDLAGSRFSPMTQINSANVKTLAPRWLFQHGVIDGVSNQTTPVVVDGRMYVTDSRGSIYALDAADGHLLWNYDVTSLIGGGAREGYVFRNRGVVYADGVVYGAAGSFLFALDAKTGQPVQSFGNNGQASVILDVLRERYPDVKTAISMGYWFTTAPQYYNGVLYIGSTRSESHIPGGHVLAVSAKTGKVLWVFNTVPQNEKDQGWDIAGPTWVGGERNGGGIWETPAIDPALGLVYVAVGNPYGDSKKRAGTNLFSDAIVALTLNNGTLKWYFQQTHHDVWDYDSGGPPTLFDMQVAGRPVKALAQASKNGYLYILNRETGQPVHPIKEMPVPVDDRPGEHGWPTQPIPFTAAGQPMEPVSPIFPIDIAPAHLATNKAVPNFSPPRPNVVMAPGTGGGANYSPIAYSPQTGLLYVNAIDAPFNAGPGRGAKGYFSAYDPTTGDLKWRQIFEGYGQAGAVVTAGGVVFVGTGSNVAGYFFAFDAKTGDPLWKFNTGAGVFSSPSVYMVNGEEFVTVASGGGDRGRRGGDLILSFALPKP